MTAAPLDEVAGIRAGDTVEFTECPDREDWWSYRAAMTPGALATVNHVGFNPEAGEGWVSVEPAGALGRLFRVPARTVKAVNA